VALGDLLLELTPRAFPGWYQKLTDHVLAPAHQRTAESAARRFRGKRILDYGTGPGTWPVRVLRLEGTLELHAVDKSDHLLLRAEDNARHAGFRKCILHGLVEAGAFPWPGQCYDLVVSQFVLGESLPDAAALVLERFHELLKPGGECWLIEARKEASVHDTTILRELRAGSVLSRWVPPRWQLDVVKAVRSRLWSESDLKRLVEHSPFGGFRELSLLPLRFGSVVVADGAQWLKLRRAEVETRAIDGG